MADNPTFNTLRDWKERNQGAMPQDDPKSQRKTTDRDIARPDETIPTSGETTGEPASMGTSGDGDWEEPDSFSGADRRGSHTMAKQDNQRGKASELREDALSEQAWAKSSSKSPDDFTEMEEEQAEEKTQS